LIHFLEAREFVPEDPAKLSAEALKRPSLHQTEFEQISDEVRPVRGMNSKLEPSQTVTEFFDEMQYFTI